MQPIHGEHPYIFVDGVYLKRSWGGEVQNVSVLVAIGVNAEGYREILGVAEGSREDKESWSNFFRYLKDRGLKGVKLVISDKASRLVDVLGDFFPAAKWQRCVVHWYRNAFNKCPYKHVKTVAAMLKAIHAQEDKEAARQKAVLVADKLRGMKLDSVAKFVEDSVEETLSYMDFPYEHWVKIRTNNGLERIMKEIRRRTRVVGSFPDGYSAMIAHIRKQVSEDELLAVFISECEPYCEAFGGHLVPSRRAFALWITLGLAEGEMSSIYRKALDLLRKEFKHSALLFGAMGALPVYGAAAVVGGVGMGLLAAIAGGLKTLKHKQVLDKYVPIISEDFMIQAEKIIAEASVLENDLDVNSDTEKQARYNILVQQLEEIINPPSDDEDEENE